MRAFLRWFNEGTGPAVADDVLKAGLAHLWFVTIHPFDDGNGRIAPFFIVKNVPAALSTRRLYPSAAKE